MFSFFKKKKPPVVEPVVNNEVATPTAPAAESIEPVVVSEPVIETKVPVTVTPPPPPVAAEAPASRKLSWTERLKSGLAKTRDKLCLGRA